MRSRPAGVQGGQVGVDHHRDQPFEADGGLPAEHVASLGGISDEEVHLCWPHESWVLGHVARPVVDPHVSKGDIEEFVDRVGLACGQDVIRHIPST